MRRPPTAAPKSDKVHFRESADPHAAVERPVDSLRPSPENATLYRPVRPDDPAVIELAEAIARDGVLEPIVASADGFILSGHRRHCAAGVAGLATVPVRTLPILRSDDRDAFTRLLREFNRNRDKTRAERTREELIDADPDEEYQALLAHRAEESRLDDRASLDLGDVKTRKRISQAKVPFLAAINRVLEAQRDYWPLSDRRVHYLLLNDPPLIHASKPDSRYRNDGPSYKALTELLTRARLTGRIPSDSIADETRPVTQWGVFPDAAAFVRRELEVLFKGYRRDLMLDQPVHVEVLCEKNTARPIIEPVAGRYGIPVTTGRGYCSLPPRQELAARFEASGKDRLALLIVSDFDPDGEEIARSFARSMRDDFGLDPHAIKVALTREQAARFNLPLGGAVKWKTYKAGPKKGRRKPDAKIERFVAASGGEHVWELEALDPADLAGLLREAIDGVIDSTSFNAALDAEKADAAHLAVVRRTVHAEARYALADVEGVDDDE